MKTFAWRYVMKKYAFTKFCILFCLISGIWLIIPGQMKVHASENVTVQGNVMSGTTNGLLKLSTKEGNMEIKIDSATDASACKILLPGKKIYVTVTHGNDGYLHAVRITSGTQQQTVTLDSSTNAVVTGTINEKSKDDILCVDTPQGQMEIKLDQTTDMSACSVLVVDKTYTITCARGSDAYMHAVSITESASAGSASSAGASSLTPSPESPVSAGTSTVTGTVDKKSKADLMYLATAYGEMQIVIDRNTDTRNGLFLIPGRKMTVTVYRGSDAYMHAATVFGEKEAVLPAVVDTSSASTVTGTVSSKSTENILFLQTQGGMMELKMDVVSSMTGYKVLTTDRKVTVTCARGSDAYMHALSITGN